MKGTNIVGESASSYRTDAKTHLKARAEATDLGTASVYHEGVEELANQRLWYLNRVIVDPPTERRKGFGSGVLRELQEALVASGRCDVLLVTPGGYGGNPREQRRFYKQNGFRIVSRDKRDGDAVMMIWRPGWSTSQKNK